MRYFLTFLTLGLFTISAWAQPLNDDCGGIVDLGLAPVCSDDIFTNVDATTTDIGFGNNPSCFNGGTAQRDVFFSFMVDPAMVDLTISIIGSDLGPNGVSITNPQIALYRGSCMTDGLAELVCASADIGDTSIDLDAVGLSPGITYFIRVNDYSDSGTPNWGDFQVCIEEYIPEINIGTDPTSATCFGTLFDSGGPDDDYTNNENHTFTVCPTDFTQCIEIDVVSFAIVAGGDVLNVYAGPDITSPSIASLSGVDNGEDFEILATSSCVTFQFISDGFSSAEGFELTWQCSASECDASSFDNPTPISGLPFTETGFSTCGDGATFNETPCNNAPFLNGPETVFAYTSEGGYCATVEVTGGTTGTGVVVLNGPPDDPATVCLGSNGNGTLSIVDFQTPGVYYIVVANGTGCTNFGLNIIENDCTVSPALVDALCNPLNGCSADDFITEFIFEDGFQDIVIGPANDGCLGPPGAQTDYFWFTIEAQADGPFGFILEGTNFASDIDFNVWGPFTSEEVCETPNDVVDFITNNQPIRSSYAAGADPTGLADTHPVLNTPVIDEYDCLGDNDDFVQTVPTIQGEVYVVLVNDWGDDILDGSISIDWSPSNPDVLANLGYTVEANDTTICAGNSAQLNVITGINNIEWVGEFADELSCTDCFDPIATPASSRVYQGVLDAVCYHDTVEITVNVYTLEAGQDLTTCIGEEFDIPVGEDFTDATYSWSPPAGLDFSCLDCPSPSVVSQVAGVYEVPVSLIADDCSFMDIFTITVLADPAPEYIIADSDTLCIGESIFLGGDETTGHTYEWTSVPDGGSVPSISNPEVTPGETTTYYLSVSNGQCPVPSTDSVTVTVAQYPIADIIASMDTICRGDTISLVNSITETGVEYSWDGGPTILNADSVYTDAIPASTGTYTLTADRLGCTTEATYDIEVTPIGLNLNQADTTLICIGEEVNISSNVAPAGAIIEWNIADVTGNTPTLSPTDNTTYIATVTNGECVRIDTFYIQVDSIPLDMTITAEPMKDSYCQGELVELTSPIYEPANYPFIEHQWEGPGMETSDTLYNLVLTTVDTFTYIRTTTSGACMNIDTILLNVVTNEMLTITPATPELCPGETVDLLLTADALGELSWDPSGTLSCDDCPNPTASPTQTTTYTVTSEIADCPVESSVEVVVLEIPGFNIIGDQVACDGASFDLNLGPFGQPGVTFAWTSSTDPGFLETTESINVTAGAPTTYSVTASNLCGEISDEVFIAQASEPTFTLPEDLTVCLGSPFNLTAIIENDQFVTSTVWIYDGESEIGSSVEFTGTNSGMATFNVEYGAPNGTICGVLTGSVNVNVVDQVYTIGIETDPVDADTLFGGTSFTLNALVDPPTGFDYSYSWTGEGVESPDAATTIVNTSPVTSDVTNVYTLNVSTPEGCDQTASISVLLQPTLIQVPNIFSPNNDQINEEFRLFSNTMPTDFNLQIFNRWGQLVFETNDPAEGWDGTIDGDPAPSDVYIYQMDGNLPSGPISELEEAKGQVTLVR